MFRELTKEQKLLKMAKQINFHKGSDEDDDNQKWSWSTFESNVRYDIYMIFI